MPWLDNLPSPPSLSNQPLRLQKPDLHRRIATHLPSHKRYTRLRITADQSLRAAVAVAAAIAFVVPRSRRPSARPDASLQLR